MRASEYTAHMVARATTGQRLDISYDRATHAVVFKEHDWNSDVRGTASPRSAFREQLETRVIRRMPRRFS